MNINTDIKAWQVKLNSNKLNHKISINKMLYTLMMIRRIPKNNI